MALRASNFSRVFRRAGFAIAHLTVIQSTFKRLFKVHIS